MICLFHPTARPFLRVALLSSIWTVLKRAFYCVVKKLAEYFHEYPLSQLQKTRRLSLECVRLLVDFTFVSGTWNARAQLAWRTARDGLNAVNRSRDASAACNSLSCSPRLLASSSIRFISRVISLHPDGCMPVARSRVHTFIASNFLIDSQKRLREQYNRGSRLKDRSSS